MDRPFDIDDSGVWHSATNECDYTVSGDGNLNGLHKGVAFYGDGVCPDCFTESRREEIFSVVLKKVKHGE